MLNNSPNLLNFLQGAEDGSSGSSGRVRGGRETWNLCCRPWWSFLWLIFTGPGGHGPLGPPGSATGWTRQADSRGGKSQGRGRESTFSQVHQHETKTTIVRQQSWPVWVLDCIQIEWIKGQTKVTAASSTETLYGILLANETVIGFLGWNLFLCKLSRVCVILKQSKKSRNFRIDENWILKGKLWQSHFSANVAALHMNFIQYCWTFVSHNDADDENTLRPTLSSTFQLFS